MTLYRLIFKDGSVGAWSANQYYIDASAKITGAKVEARRF